MYIDIDCNHIKTIDPKQMGARRPFLTVTADIDQSQAVELLIDLLKSGIVEDHDIKQALKEQRFGLFCEIGDEAIEEVRK